MSLIDDALKRAQAAGEGERGKPGDRPWIPTPMPDAGLARQRALVRWLTIALCAAVALAVSLLVLGRSGRSAPPLPAAGGPGEERAAAAPIPATATPTTVVVSTPVSVARVRPTRAPRTATDDAAEAEVAASAEIPTPAAVHPSQNGAHSAKSYVGSVTLSGGAKIELGGIVWSETEPRALLNDRILPIGGYVEGYNVTKIEEGRVALEKDGVTIYLSVK